MFKLIGAFFVGLTAVVLSEWPGGLILNAISGIAYRAYSIFTGEWNVPVSILRKKHDDSIWPWVIVSCLIGGLIMLALAL